METATYEATYEGVTDEGVTDEGVADEGMTENGAATRQQVERRQVLELLAAGSINVDEALELLAALDSPSTTSAPRPSSKRPASKPAKAVHVSIQRPNAQAINIAIPVKLAEFGIMFIPDGVRSQLAEQGIVIDHLAHLLAMGDLPEGRLVDISNEQDGASTRITVDVS
ncbi:MAG: hypothetical protein AAF708_05120 [Deinococcota bacterium]